MITAVNPMYTKSWFREMQVAGYLVFHETREDWEEDIAWYLSEGRDYWAEARSNLEYYKNDLLEFLPEPFHPYIHDGSLGVKFPSTELRAMAKQWKQDYEERNRRQMAAYRANLLAIRDTLPATVVQLCDRPPHDVKVVSFHPPKDGEFSMILDGSGNLHPFASPVAQLTFSGVRSWEATDFHEGSVWIYSEVYAKEQGQFELHILLDSPLGELTVTAENLEIENL